MKKALTAFLCLLGTGLVSAFGATNFGTFAGFAKLQPAGRYTADLNGNSLNDDGSVTIGTTPIKLTYDASQTWYGTSGMTIVMKYSSLPTTGVNAELMSTSLHTGYANGVGIYATSDKTIGGIKQDVVQTTTGTTALADSGYIVYTYLNTNSDSYSGYTGTFVYDGSGSLLFSDSSLYASGQIGTTLYFGGMSDNTLPATGLTIDGLAVYYGLLTTTAEITTAVADYDAYAATNKTTTISGSTSVSALNTLLGDATAVTLILADDVTLTYDTTFTASSVSFSSTGASLTLSADTAPSADEFAKLDFTDMAGAVHRSWLGEGEESLVLGFNFNASNATDTDLAMEIGTWYHDTTQGASGTSTNFFSDGLTELTWTASNLWSENGSASMSSDSPGTFIQGYLDDASPGPTITVTAIPYDEYDVIIYCSTDNGTLFQPKLVNGSYYTWDSDSSATVVGTSSSTWGDASAAAGKAVYGYNTLRVNGLKGTLTINGGIKSGTTTRGCIGAFQIMPTGTSTAPTLTAGEEGQTTSINWSDTTYWNVEEVPTSGTVAINVTGDVVLTIDSAVSLGAVTVSGTGSLTIQFEENNETASFTASSMQSPVTMILKNALDIETASFTGAVYYDYTTDSVASSTGGSYYSAGAGSTDSTTTVSLTGGTLGLTGGTFYFPSYQSMASGTQTSVEVSGTAVIDMSAAGASDGNRFSVGQATYTLSDSASITTERFVLSDGAAGRTAIFTMSNSSSVAVSGRSSYHSVDSNQADIMFGHWAGPSTFTMEDTATFSASDSDVLVGLTAYNQTINMNGGTMTVKGIKASSGASGTNTLNLNGGTLELGSTGIDTHSSSRTITVNVTEDTAIYATASTMPISQPVVVAEGKTLTLKNAAYDEETAAEVDWVTVTLSGALTGTGTIKAGPYVNLVLKGDARTGTDTTIDISEANSTLAVYLADDIDVVTLTIVGDSTDTSRISVYDGNETLIDTPTVSSEDNVYTISSGTKVFSPTSTSSALSTTTLWDTNTPAVEGEPFEIALTEDVTLDIDTELTYGAIYVTGTGTLTLTANLPATSLSLGDNVVLALNGTTSVITNTTPISGAAAVLTDGTVVMASVNTFSGGLTVQSGCLSTTQKDGYGGPSGSSTVTVNDGAAVDLANTNNHVYRFVITGKGNETEDGGYTGVLFNSGNEIQLSHAQMSSLTLNGDATIVAGSGHNWGILTSGYQATTLTLNGYTLTKEGEGTFFLCNTTGTAGTIDVTEGTLRTYYNACTLTGVTNIINGGATLQVSSNLGGSGCVVRLLPTNTASVGLTGVSAIQSAVTTILDTSAIDVEQLNAGDEVTFVTDSASGLANLTFTDWTGGRYTTTVAAAAITGVFADPPTNFWHYSFDNGYGYSDAKADDSTYAISTWQSGASLTTSSLVASKNGNAATLDANYRPYWNSNTAGMSPFYTGLGTVTTVLKPMETGSNAIIWCLGGKSDPGYVLLVIKDSTTVALCYGSSTTYYTAAEVTDIADLTSRYHFVAMKFSATGTTLRVDDTEVTVDTVVPITKVAQRGQIGTLSGNLNDTDFSAATATYLDDWQIYSCLLKDSELDALKKAYLIRPLILSIQ